MFNCYITPHPPIIVKEIGGKDTLKVSSTINAMEKISDEIAEIDPETIIVISPHGIVFSDANAIFTDEKLRGDFSNFGNFELNYEFENDEELCYKIIKNCADENVPIAMMNSELKKKFNVKNDLDHGMLVPLSFILQKHKKFKVIPINYGFLSNILLYKFGCAIEKSIRELSKEHGKVVIIASGDLSHKLSDSGPYSFAECGPVYDEKIVAAIKSNEPENILEFDTELTECAGECGLRSFMIMAGALSQYKTEAEVLSYEGPFGVGYCVARYKALEYEPKNLIPELTKSNEIAAEKISSSMDTYAKLAKSSLEYFIKTGQYLDDIYIPTELLDIKRPVFVSLKEAGNLRGCIGATSSTYSNVGQEIIRFAVEAGTRDPRFSPVIEEELGELKYSVDELFPLEAVSNLDELDPEIYGVVVSQGNKRGLLLPNLEGVDTVEKQIGIAAQKAGITDLDNIELQKFKVIRHK